MKLNKILSEALKDIATDNKIYHRTNLNTLYAILNSGKLLPRFYASNTYTNNHHDNFKKEIATARKSTFSALDKGKSDPRQLSSKLGSIEIEIFKDRIKTIRNVKVKPIAELPRESEKWMIQALDPIYGNRKIQRRIILQLMNDYKNKLFDEDSFEDYAADHLDLNKDTDFAEQDLKILKRHFFKYYDFIQGREGEERIQTNEGIPLKPEYLMIRILPSFKYARNIDEKVYDLILKNKELFIQDKNYKGLLEYLKKEISQKDSPQP